MSGVQSWGAGKKSSSAGWGERCEPGPHIAATCPLGGNDTGLAAAATHRANGRGRHTPCEWAAVFLVTLR